MSEHDRQRLSQDVEAEYPWPVDIPIPRGGLGPMLPIILDAAKSCPGGAIVYARAEPAQGPVQSWFERIATKTPNDAQRLAKTFQSLGARRAR